MRWLLVLLLLTGALAAGAAWLAVEPSPLVGAVPPLAPAEIDRVRALLQEHDPRRQREGNVRTAAVTERDATLLANYLLNRFGAADARVLAATDQVELQVSWVLPDNPRGRYLNLSSTLRATDTLPRLSALRVGRLQIPPALGNALYDYALAWLDRRTGNAVSSGLIRQVALTDDRIRIVYQWQSSALGSLGSELLDPELLARVAAYQDHLLPERGGSVRIQLAQALSSAMALARQRSPGGDPVAENRAAIVALEALTNRRDLARIVPAARPWPAGFRPTVVLDGRRDFAQHFMLSAALVAFGDQGFAQAIGLSKEIQDSRGGSGFSFMDLAADNAGTRFGQLAAGTPDSARRIQDLLAAGADDRALMPVTADLPERLDAQRFAALYGSIDDPRFRRMTEEIDRRIAALPLYAD